MLLYQINILQGYHRLKAPKMSYPLLDFTMHDFSNITLSTVTNAIVLLLSFSNEFKVLRCLDDLINPFPVADFFLYSLKTSENQNNVMFSGGTGRHQWHEMS